MNPQFRTILFTVLTLSTLVILAAEITNVSLNTMAHEHPVALGAMAVLVAAVAGIEYKQKASPAVMKAVHPLFTLVTAAAFAMALFELSGVNKSLLYNKLHIGSNGEHGGLTINEENDRQKRANGMPRTTVQFTGDRFDFGDIKEGDVVKHSYHFRNVGSAPYLIIKAEASCGCTIPSFPKDPIVPGGEGDIVVQFNSNGKEGHIDKGVMIYSNGQQEKMSVTFTANVIK